MDDIIRLLECSLWWLFESGEFVQAGIRYSFVFRIRKVVLFPESWWRMRLSSGRPFGEVFSISVTEIPLAVMLLKLEVKKWFFLFVDWWWKEDWIFFLLLGYCRRWCQGSPGCQVVRGNSAWQRVRGMLGNPGSTYAAKRYGYQESLLFFALMPRCAICAKFVFGIQEMVPFFLQQVDSFRRSKYLELS